jgi:hypothetical protein
VCAAAAGALVAAGEVAEGLGLFCRAAEMAQAVAGGPDDSGRCHGARAPHASLQAAAARLAQQLLAAGRAAALAPLLRLLSGAGVERLLCAALLSCLIDSLVRPSAHLSSSDSVQRKMGGSAHLIILGLRRLHAGFAESGQVATA